jgi:RNA polymerase sigma-70 factor (ECF subfamily)
MSASAVARHSPEQDRLLQAARAGDAAAFSRLAEEYRAYLKSVAQRILADRLPSDGSDVVQTGLGVAFQHLSELRDQDAAGFLSWLARIVRNEALRSLRQAGRLKPLPDGSGEQPAGSSSGPDAKVAHREDAARLLAAIERLPEDYRMVIDLRNLKELPFEHVAQRMGRSSAAVRKLWTRAMDRLRQELGDEP